MSAWVLPSFEHLSTVVSTSEGHLLLCSPFISSPALDVVADSLSDSVTTIEVWTRLETRDWLTGASDPEGLLDFMRQVEPRVGTVAVRQAERLHAKIVISEGPTALAGSANLTIGGFGRNFEASRMVGGTEVSELRNIVNQVRPHLTGVARDQLETFVAQCTAKVDSREALLELVREEMPPPQLGPSPLVPYHTFLAFLENEIGDVAQEILNIARNHDRNNNTGKVKQAFYGVQRFLQEYPSHREFVRNLSSNEWFEVQHSPLFQDWEQFLDDFAEEVDEAFQYSIPTLRGYLTPASGGGRIGGGGGDNQFKRVWPFVGRILED